MQTELEAEDQCFECGADLLATDLPVFALDADRYLCAHCSAKRGGRFDQLEQSWNPAPSVDDLV